MTSSASSRSSVSGNMLLPINQFSPIKLITEIRRSGKLLCNNIASRTCKIVLLGEPSVGKSSFYLRFDKNHFNQETNVTKGVDTFFKYVEANDTIVKIQTWDTGIEDEPDNSKVSAFIRGADAVILMYDVTSRSSFRAIDKWNMVVDNCKPGMIKVISANKIDLIDDPMIQFSESRSLASQLGIPIFETSAKEGINVTTTFEFLLNECLKGSNTHYFNF